MVLGDLHVGAQAEWILCCHHIPLSILQINFGSYVRRYFGEEVWADALAHSGQDSDSSWTSSCPYHDSVFDRCVATVAKIEFVIHSALLCLNVSG